MYLANKINFYKALFFLIFVSTVVNSQHEDNEFAEFEEFEDDMFESPPPKKRPNIVMSPDAVQDDKDFDATVENEDEENDEDEDDEFSHLSNKDEFEGFDDKKSNKPPPNLQFVQAPAHMHTSWEHYSIEVLMLAGLLAYLLNYLAGKSRNQKLAEEWLNVHKKLLEDNFSVVGDNGLEAGGGELMKESENVFNLWCSGRTCCEGMLVTIKLLKRQDLVSVISCLLRPSFDQIQVRVDMDDNDMEQIVFCLVNKKTSNKLMKEHEDLSTFCVDKKSADKYQLPPHLQVLSEFQEVASFILDAKVSEAVRRYEDMIDYIHFSDQYCPNRNNDETQQNVPLEKTKVLSFCFNMTSKQAKNMEGLKPLMQMVMYLIDKVKRIKLSKEAKTKAERSRQRALEMTLKAGHIGRSEAAQNRKEERKRLIKEKIMNEDDPEKQRRLEEKNLKKEAKKKQPRMKRVKIKSM